MSAEFDRGRITTGNFERVIQDLRTYVQSEFQSVAARDLANSCLTQLQTVWREIESSNSPSMSQQSTSSRYSDESPRNNR